MSQEGLDGRVSPHAVESVPGQPLGQVPTLTSSPDSIQPIIPASNDRRFTTRFGMIVWPSVPGTSAGGGSGTNSFDGCADMSPTGSSLSSMKGAGDCQHRQEVDHDKGIKVSKDTSNKDEGRDEAKRGEDSWQQEAGDHTTPKVVLRSACDSCHRMKRKCDGNQPCIRCKRRSRDCSYSCKQKSGPPKGSKRKIVEAVEDLLEVRQRNKLMPLAVWPAGSHATGRRRVQPLPPSGGLVVTLLEELTKRQEQAVTSCPVPETPQGVGAVMHQAIPIPVASSGMGAGSRSGYSSGNGGYLGQQGHLPGMAGKVVTDGCSGTNGVTSGMVGSGVGGRFEVDTVGRGVGVRPETPGETRRDPGLLSGSLAGGNTVNGSFPYRRQGIVSQIMSSLENSGSAAVAVTSAATAASSVMAPAMPVVAPAAESVVTETIASSLVPTGVGEESMVMPAQVQVPPMSHPHISTSMAGLTPMPVPVPLPLPMPYPHYGMYPSFPHAAYAAYLAHYPFPPGMVPHMPMFPPAGLSGVSPSPVSGGMYSGISSKVASSVAAPSVASPGANAALLMASRPTQDPSQDVPKEHEAAKQLAVETLLGLKNSHGSDSDTTSLAAAMAPSSSHGSNSDTTSLAAAMAPASSPEETPSASTAKGENEAIDGRGGVLKDAPSELSSCSGVYPTESASAQEGGGGVMLTSKLKPISHRKPQSWYKYESRAGPLKGPDQVSLDADIKVSGGTVSFGNGNVVLPRDASSKLPGVQHRAKEVQVNAESKTTSGAVGDEGGDVTLLRDLESKESGVKQCGDAAESMGNRVSKVDETCRNVIAPMHGGATGEVEALASPVQLCAPTATGGMATNGMVLVAAGDVGGGEMIGGAEPDVAASESLELQEVKIAEVHCQVEHNDSGDTLVAQSNLGGKEVSAANAMVLAPSEGPGVTEGREAIAAYQ